MQPSTVNTFVATNGASVSANYNVTSAILQQSNLGRALAPGLRVPDGRPDAAGPGVSGPRQLARPAGREGPAASAATGRTSGFDFYNLFNANTGTAFNQVYDVASNGATWLRPTTILSPRFARFNVTVDF